MTVLKCSDLVCSFNGVQALDGVDLDINKIGSCTAIIGPNSAGKATLLNAICGLASLDSGEVVMNGRDVTSWSFSARAKAGLIRSYEGSGVWAKLSVLDNVAAGGWGLKLVEARKMGAEVLTRIGLHYALERPGEALSMGERRKLELARVLLRLHVLGRDTLVVLDEPFRGLDAEAQDDFEELLRTHLIGQATLLMVEHNREKAKGLADNLLWIENGKLTGRIPPNALQVDRIRRPIGLSSVAVGAPRIALTFRNIHAGYGALKVLRGVSLDCSLGEAIQIDGSNGCGKSTLMNVATGGLAPTSGIVALSGVEMPDGGERVSRGLVMVHQGGRLIGQMAVRTHLELAKRAADRRGITDHSSDLFLDAFPVLRELIEERADELASGHRALVALWIALATAPIVLLADEPGAALAPDLRERVYSFLHENWLSGEKCLVFVEHTTCRPWARIVRLRGGLLMQEKSV